MKLLQSLKKKFKSDRIKIIVLFVIAFVLRLIAARNLGVSADDVNHAVRPIGIFGSGKLVIWDQSTSLWYYVQGVFYKFFGATQIASRFANVIFGSLLVVMVFVFVKKNFSKRAGLYAALLTAFSPMLIKSTLPEMDTLAAFITLMSLFFFMEFLRNYSNKKIAISAILIGVGVMIKLYVLFFAISMSFFLIYYEIFRRKNKTKRIVSAVLIWGIIITALVLPTLVHNYLLYKDKGFMDLIFTNTLKIGFENATAHYQGNAGWLAPTDYKGFFIGNQKNFDPTSIPGFLMVLGLLFRGDVLLCVFFLVGLVFVFRQNKDYLILFLAIFIPAFIYLGAYIPMSKHFIWALVIGAPIAGLGVDNILKKYPKELALVVFIALFSMVYLGMPKDVAHAHFYGQSAFGELISAKESFSRGSIVVADSRIYRGSIHWALAGTNYLEAITFVPLLQESKDSGNSKNFEIYYIECVIDDCGWGTVASQPKFNESMEDVTSFFERKAHTIINLSEPNPHNYYLPLMGNKQITYRIYKADMAISPTILASIKKTHFWFEYPIGYDRKVHKIFDDYDVSSNGDITLQWFAFKIFYLELILVFLTIPILGYLFWRET